MRRSQRENAVDVQFGRVSHRPVPIGHVQTPSAPVRMVGRQLQRVLGQEIRRGTQLPAGHAVFKEKGLSS